MCIRDRYKDVDRFRNSVWITSAFILLIVIMGLIGYVNDETCLLYTSTILRDMGTNVFYNGNVRLTESTIYADEHLFSTLGLKLLNYDIQIIRTVANTKPIQKTKLITG